MPASSASPPEAQMQGHHGALAEAHQRDTPGLKPVPFHFGIQKPVKHRDRRREALRHLHFRRAIEPRDRKPLPAGRIRYTGLRRIRRNERGSGQDLRQGPGETNQIAAIGTVAMQQHHERICETRRDARPGPVDPLFSHHRSLLHDL